MDLTGDSTCPSTRMGTRNAEWPYIYPTRLGQACQCGARRRLSDCGGKLARRTIDSC
ncbi:uncharacterized protein LAESUDRAFT_571582 [Laetiporus sulphureus 93-53]|uniref:Uncharacterized protein n=1 Tax=Laetiporus sulphureus 93-53 TaxID=1314785 RepID=A0A165FJ95_9APHY|nr:uncharacterized protein LAESUDRAFT_571582 [Laetiporus sulphureus 93-53]KZT09057.1 hypothetical protein LAESUDRAFT_571582 [Laetiporus sulphureus 93-53]